MANDELDPLHDGLRSTRASIKRTQKALRELLRFATDLEERLAALENAQPEEAQRERNNHPAPV